MTAIGEIASHSAYDMFLYKYLIVHLAFFPAGFLDLQFLSDCTSFTTKVVEI